MLRKIIKKAASVILAIALMVTYVPVVAIAADEEPITAESYQAQLDKVATAEEALAEAEAALTAAEEKLAAEAEEIKDAKAEYDLAVEEYEKVKSAIAEAEVACEEAKAEYDAATAELLAKTEDMPALMEDAASKTATQAEELLKLEALKAEQLVYETEKAALEATLELLLPEKIALETKKLELETTQTDWESTKTEIEARIAANEENLEEVNAKLAEIKKIEDRYEVVKAELEALEAEVATQQAAYDKAGEELAAVIKTIEEKLGEDADVYAAWNEAENEYVLAKEALEAAELLDDGVDAAMEIAEQVWDEICEKSGYAAAEAEKNEAEAAKLASEEALAAAKAELEAMNARLVEARFTVQAAYKNGANGSKVVARRVTLGTGLVYRNTDGSYEVITMPENVQKLIDEGTIEEVSRGKAGVVCRVEYKYTSTSVAANFYILKGGIEMPENPLDRQPQANYILVGSATINTGLEPVSGEDNIPDEIQSHQFDLADSETAKYVWYAIKEETSDGWHVDGYISSADDTTPDADTTPGGGNTTPDDDTTPDGGNTTPGGSATSDEDDDILYGPENPDNTDEFNEPDDNEPVVTPEVEPEVTPEVEQEEVPVVDFEDEITPLAPPTEWAEFEDEETPLDDVPQTGSVNLVLPAMAVSCVALVVATVSRKKEETAE